jgi:NAD dependent epimerase/dehydratase family enzyme
MFGFGGTQGSGNQFISWIHEKDFARAVEFIIDEKLTGIINIVSPKPIKNRDFMKTLQKSLKVVIGIPVGERLLKLGAKLIGTESELVLKSRNVIPKRLIENGFNFEYGDLKKAFENLNKKL